MPRGLHPLPTATGVITEDPAKEAEIGSMLQIEWINHGHLIECGAGRLGKEWTHFGTALLALSFSDGRTYHLGGSAVLIAPGLALAAKHVLEPILSELLAGTLAPLAISVTSHGIVIWRLHQIIHGGTDVVILCLNMASEFPPDGLKCATLTTRTPAVGERVMIAGVRSDQVVENGQPLGLTVRIGVGEVSAIYPLGRDRAMLPTPCVEVRCLTVGGMSGGPAFDLNGNLIGTLTSSMEDDGGPSYVSLWWPTAGDLIDSVWPPGMVPLPTTLLEMAAAGLVRIEKPDALTASVNYESEHPFEVNYEPWT